jgi:succinate-semialdehyde dehydrogenase/glutarate-semialdehyde dehydrogenase
VLNVVTTSSAGETTAPVIADRRLRKVSFTGSTPEGKRLVAQASEHAVRVSMELGGNAPFLVFEDADLDAALVPLQRSLALLSEVVTLSLQDVRRSARGQRLVDDAVRRGAQVVLGGSVPIGLPAELSGGHFYSPTVLTEVRSGARLLREEIFGPVAPIVAFDQDAKVIAAANDTEFGLMAYVSTSNLERALRTVEALVARTVGLNQGLVSNPAAPFGGMKGSGYGREGGSAGIDEYLETKYVSIKLA